MVNDMRWQILLLCALCIGCARLSSNNVILLPEDRIYTLPEGQPVNVLLDGKPLSMTFAMPMKICSPTVLVRQEQELNKKALEAVGARKQRNQSFGIFGGLIAAIGAVFAFFKKK